jgi:hypothetical protein
VHLTLMLVFFIILITAVVRPFDEQISLAGPLFQRLEILSLVALFCTLWAAAVFSNYPRCEAGGGDTGQTLAWCDFIAVAVGGADVIVILLLVLLFLREKGVLVAAAGLPCCRRRCCKAGAMSCGGRLLPTAVREASGREVENPWAGGKEDVQDPEEDMASSSGAGETASVHVELAPVRARGDDDDDPLRTNGISNPMQASALRTGGHHPVYVTAAHDYIPAEEGEILLQAGDRVETLAPLDDDWARGRNTRTGAEGLYPVVYCSAEQ